MNYYLVIWIAVTVFLLVFWFWSLFVLYKQKQVWKAFAKSKGLRYRSNSMLDSPEISGLYKDYKVYLFTAEHDAAGGRYPRRLTSIEITLKTVLPGALAVASGGMVQVVEELNFVSEYRPEQHGWDNSYIARSRDETAMKDYLTGRRVQALINLMKLNNSWLILFFSSGLGLLRLDTPDPLSDLKKLNDYLNKLIESAQIVELEKGESEKLALKAQLKSQTQTRQKAKEIEAPENILDQHLGLVLEDDD